VSDVISDVIICCLRSCDTDKINAPDKVMFEDQTKKKIMEIKGIFK